MGSISRLILSIDRESTRIADATILMCKYQNRGCERPFLPAAEVATTWDEMGMCGRTLEGQHYNFVGVVLLGVIRRGDLLCNFYPLVGGETSLKATAIHMCRKRYPHDSYLLWGP